MLKISIIHPDSCNTIIPSCTSDPNLLAEIDSQTPETISERIRQLHNTAHKEPPIPYRPWWWPIKTEKISVCSNCLSALLSNSRINHLESKKTSVYLPINFSYLPFFEELFAEEQRREEAYEYLTLNEEHENRHLNAALSLGWEARKGVEIIRAANRILPFLNFNNWGLGPFIICWPKETVYSLKELAEAQLTILHAVDDLNPSEADKVQIQFWEEIQKKQSISIFDDAFVHTLLYDYRQSIIIND